MVREEKSLCPLLKQRQLQSWPSPIPLHCLGLWAFQWDAFSFDQILAAVVRLSGQHSVTNQDHLHTHPALSFCNSPTLKMGGRKMNEEFARWSKSCEEEKEFRRQRRKERTRWRHSKQVLSPRKLTESLVGISDKVSAIRDSECIDWSLQKFYSLVVSLPKLWLWCLEIKKETVHPDLMAVSKHAHTLTSSHPSSFSLAFLYSSWERLFKQHGSLLVWLFGNRMVVGFFWRVGRDGVFNPTSK